MLGRDVPFVHHFSPEKVHSTTTDRSEMLDLERVHGPVCITEFIPFEPRACSYWSSPGCAPTDRTLLTAPSVSKAAAAPTERGLIGFSLASGMLSILVGAMN